MYSNYFSAEDFNQLKPVRMNREQLWELIKNEHFLEVASTAKIVESLHFVSRIKGGLDFYDKRPSLLNALHNFESQKHVTFLLQYPSYLATLAATAGRMEVTDSTFWHFVASLLARSMKTMNLRELANAIFGISRAAHKSPIILDFSDLLVQMESEILLAFHKERESLVALRMESGSAESLKSTIRSHFRNLSRSLA